MWPLHSITGFGFFFLISTWTYWSKLRLVGILSKNYCIYTTNANPQANKEPHPGQRLPVESCKILIEATFFPASAGRRSAVCRNEWRGLEGNEGRIGRLPENDPNASVPFVKMPLQFPPSSNPICLNHWSLIWLRFDQLDSLAFDQELWTEWSCPRCWNIWRKLCHRAISGVNLAILNPNGLSVLSSAFILSTSSLLQSPSILSSSHEKDVFSCHQNNPNFKMLSVAK